MKRIITSCMIALLLIIMVSCSSLPVRIDEPFRKTKDVAQEIGNTLVSSPGGVSAVSIAIMHQGEIIYSKGFGKRDVARGLPVESNSRFNIGSISKVFTAVSILLLQEDGLLTLDDTVSDLMGSFTMADERYKEITVRMLLNHSSGMPGTNMRGGFSASAASDYLEQSIRELGSSMLKHDPGAFSPYCNDGFIVAQALVEHLSGISFTQYLQKRIFKPLGMTETSVGFDQDDENMAYAYDDRTEKLPIEYVHLIGSGGITSTAEDLCKFAASIANQDLLGAASISEFLAEQKPTYLKESTYDRLFKFGLGWDFTEWEPYKSQGIQVLGKTGGTLEYSSMLFVIPQSQSAVALASAGRIDPMGTTLPIVEALLKESGLITMQSSSEQDEAQVVQPLESDIESYSGYYGSVSGLDRISFNKEQAVLIIEAYDGSGFKEAISARHIGKGIFEKTPNETWYTFKTLLGIPSLLEIKPYDQAEPIKTRLDQIAKHVHNFTTGPWLPINIPPFDLYVAPFNLMCIEELPSYFILDNVVYAITGNNRSSMVLPTVRDQTPPQIDDEGRLVVGSYVCIDVNAVPSLIEGESIKIDHEATTVWRRITGQGTFSCTVPEGGRLVVLGPDFSNLEDTLFSGNRRLEMDIFGSYVGFFGGEGTVFEPQMIAVN